MAFSGIFIVLLASSAFAQTPVHVMDQLADRQSCAGGDQAQRMDNGDGTWSYPLDSAFDASTIMRTRVIDWVYDRQARFPYMQYNGPLPPATVPLLPSMDAMQEIYASELRDNEGRIWRVHHVDLEELEAVRAERRARAEAIYAAAGVQPYGEVFASAPDDADPWIGQDPEYESWNWSEPCLGHPQIKVWDNESRTILFRKELNKRQQPVNWVVADNTCTGVLIHHGVTLTAAHCVQDSDCIQVCQFGNNDVAYWDPTYSYWNPYSTNLVCNEAVATIFHGYGRGVNGIGSDYGDDIAILYHGSNAQYHAEYMEPSSISDGDLESMTLHNLGYPARKPNTCDRNLGVNYGLDLPSNLTYSFMYHHTAAIAGTPGRRITSYHDGGPGQSGGPIYYCPGGTCEAGEGAFVAGILAGWSRAKQKAVSCKVNRKYDWIISHGYY